MSVRLAVPKQLKFVKDDDIRFNYDLGGGVMMDMGCEVSPFLIFPTSDDGLVLRLHDDGLPVYRRR